MSTKSLLSLCQSCLFLAVILLVLVRLSSISFLWDICLSGLPHRCPYVCWCDFVPFSFVVSFPAPSWAVLRRPFQDFNSFPPCGSGSSFSLHSPTSQAGRSQYAAWLSIEFHGRLPAGLMRLCLATSNWIAYPYPFSKAPIGQRWTFIARNFFLLCLGVLAFPDVSPFIPLLCPLSFRALPLVEPTGEVPYSPLISDTSKVALPMLIPATLSPAPEAGASPPVCSNLAAAVALVCLGSISLSPRR